MVSLNVFWPAFLMVVVVPIFTIVFFDISLCRYIRGRRSNKQQPGSVSAGDMKNRLALLLISSAMMAVLLAVVGFVIGLLSRPISFM